VEPNCPASHLVVKAKYAISQYRKRGSSIDGKLDTRSRAKHYHILSLEELIFDDGLLREEAISGPQGPRRPTEEEACINILFASLRNSLSVEENQVLTLRLMDIPWQRVGEILGQGMSRVPGMRSGWRFRDITGSLREQRLSWSKARATYWLNLKIDCDTMIIS
jgi:hypothetical protein